MNQADFEEASRKALSLFEYGQVIVKPIFLKTFIWIIVICFSVLKPFLSKFVCANLVHHYFTVTLLVYDHHLPSNVGTNDL